MKLFQHHAVALALIALAGATQAQQSTNVDKITVTGEGDKLGAGLMVDEDAPKARSTVTKAVIDKQRPGSNPYQALTYLPGVNASSVDATGLFGGNLRVRGFNSDQMGFTINGAPVNDSGNFAVYPQEYTDSENLCEMFITQGATDTEAPHVGASGGNIGMSTCGPKDERGGKVGLSFGQLSYHRFFLRGDTGKLGDFKGFLSYSNSQVDKWKGAGKADRNHLDAGAEYKVGNTSLSANLLYNRAVNNNLRTLNLTELATYGYNADFATAVPQHKAPAAGSAQVDAGTSSASPAYYGYALNPFENYLLTAAAHVQLSPALRVDVEPYYWYGYGTGGVQQVTLAESSGTTKLHGGIADINGDGDALDTVMIYRGSVTETHRPGVTTKLSYSAGNHHVLGGLWFERAEHKQTAPGTRVDNNGNIGDLWLRDSSQLLKYADGALYQNRDVLTISTGQSAFVQDAISLMGDRLQVVPSVSYRQIQRDFTNHASSGGGAGADYKINKTYSQLLPSLNSSYQFTPELQGFVGIAKNFKAPGNFEYYGLAQGVTYVNGVGTASALAPLTVKPETSVNVDVGARFKGELFKGSVTAYAVEFKDRIASAYDPVTATTHDFNVGSVSMKGLEVELGTVPYMGLSAYVSGSYTEAKMNDDLAKTATTSYATAGKQLPDTPKGMASLGLQYANGPLMVNLNSKYTSGRQLTLVNDLRIAGYTTMELNMAYQLPRVAVFKNPVVRLNVANLFDHRYLLANSGSGSSMAYDATGNPSVYMGAPRFASISLQSDF